MGSNSLLKMLVSSTGRLPKGFIGIITNNHLTIKTKVRLMKDFFNLILLTGYLTIFRKAFLHEDKEFFVSAFRYKIFFKNIFSFLFLFNEVFCISDYKARIKVQSYVDLGSNIGLSILWYHYFNPKMSVIAFEPDEDCVIYLKKNLKENGIKGKIYKIALTDKTTKMKFYKINHIVQSLDSGLKLNQNLDHQVVMVQTGRLSQYIGDKKISLVKMDIEGSEYQVIADLLKSKKILNISEIIFESHYFSKIEMSANRRLIAQMSKFGQIYSYRNSGVTSINYWVNRYLR